MKIERVQAFPLTARFETPQVTSQHSFTSASICLVRIDTDNGFTGVGECLARFTPEVHAHYINEWFAPLLKGQDPFSVGALWSQMRDVNHGRSGGPLFEAIAGVDIALWDIMGKSTGLSVGKLLGGNNREKVPAYASSIMVNEDEAAAGEKLRNHGFKAVKMKIAGAVASQVERVQRLRAAVGDCVDILIDANYCYTEAEALHFAREVAQYDVTWFEEPIDPEDRAGHLRLATNSPIALAAGESEFTTRAAIDLIGSGAIKFVQPDVTRLGGITETRNMAITGHSFSLQFAPHVGLSGIICLAATLHLASAMPNLYAYECMVTPSPFREDLAVEPVGLAEQLVDGYATVPDSPGIGIEIDWKAVDKLRRRKDE